MTRVTIALTRYREPSWLLNAALDSLAKQRDVDADVLLLDQSYDPGAERYGQALATPRVRFRYATIPPVGLSWARNCAIRQCETEIMLFIDPDAIADERWATELAGTLSRHDAAIAGGKIVARWHKPPLLLTRSNLVKEQYSLLDLGQEEKPTPKVVGTGFGIHRGRLGPLAYFDEALGRRPGGLLGGEETDLCERASQASLAVYYNGRAVVQHQILPERIRHRWILKRLYYAGVARARRGRWPQPTHGRTLADYVVAPLVLPAYAAGYAVGKLAAGPAYRSDSPPRVA